MKYYINILLQKIINYLIRNIKIFKYNNETNLILLAKLHIDRVLKLEKVDSLQEVEFKIFSQWGEDGIIQYIINKIEIPNKAFIEFGVHNYIESNTKFLLINNNWKGLIIDASKKNIKYIKNDKIYWKYNLTAINKFITKDNINQLIKDYTKEEDIGILSIDIDGNDYWILKEINVIRPRILICEYNSVFGCQYSITIPYKSEFERTKEHFSNLYWGASLPAI